MTGFLASLPVSVLAPAGLTAGFLLGLAHFRTLAKVTDLYLSGGSPARAIGFQLARFALLGGVLFALAMGGALPLLAGALGLVVARNVVLKQRRKGA